MVRTVPAASKQRPCGRMAVKSCSSSHHFHGVLTVGVRAQYRPRKEAHGFFSHALEAIRSAAYSHCQALTSGCRMLSDHVRKYSESLARSVHSCVRLCIPRNIRSTAIAVRLQPGVDGTYQAKPCLEEGMGPFPPTPPQLCRHDIVPQVPPLEWPRGNTPAQDG